MSDSKTKYINVKGKVSWAKVYTPDEAFGGVRWVLNLYPLDDAEWAKINDVEVEYTDKRSGTTTKFKGLQGKPKTDDGSQSGVEGKYITLRRDTTKLMGDKLIYFAPPHIWDADGKPILKYVGADNKLINSYETKDTKITAVGEQVSIGNGSIIDLRISVFPTQRGVGNRFEALKVIDLIEYVRPDDLTDGEVDEANGGDGEEAPW